MVERTVSEWLDGQWVTAGRKLADYRNARAVVLLGGPGSGKSTSFKLAADGEENAMSVSARRFLNRSLDAHPEWRDHTLFIDGLDEARAGGGDPRGPLDKIADRLARLGKPPFRLSCREGAWLGPNDLGELSSVVGGKTLHLLELDPLRDEDALGILSAAGIREDPHDFLWSAKERGLEVFLRNPLLLDLLVKARPGGSWPSSRIDTFDRACEDLAREENRDHLVARDDAHASDHVVLAAGRLCATLLLCDKLGWSPHGLGTDEDFPAVSQAGDQQGLLKCALNTGLFTGSAEPGRVPRHRQIAEFLAAKFLDHAIRANGLSSTRVLAWMQGVDGIVVPTLRGLSVWLASMNADVRRPLIETDPVGIAFHGDAGTFGQADTAFLLQRLEKQLEHDWNASRWEWPSSASLGALMAGSANGLLWGLLRETNRESSRQRLVVKLLGGLVTAPARPDVRPSHVLLEVIRDASWWPDIRVLALDGLIGLVGGGEDGWSVTKDLLDDIDRGRVKEDRDGELRGMILTHLYPRHFHADQIWRYAELIWSADDSVGHGKHPSPVPKGRARDFWTEHVADASSPEDVMILLDTLVEKAADVTFLLAHNGVESVVLRLLALGLQRSGETVGIAKLLKWFELVEIDDESGDLIPANCQNQVLSSDLSKEQGKIYSWLMDHPEIQMGLVLESMTRIGRDEPDRTYIHPVAAKFLSKGTPPDFRRWCLDNAVALEDVNLSAAKELVCWAVVQGLNGWPSPVTDAAARAAVGHIPSLRKRLDECALASIVHDRDMARQPTTAAYLQARARKQAYIAVIREHQKEIAAGIGPPVILRTLGDVYLRGFDQGGVDQARADLGTYLADSEDLFTVAIQGFRAVSRRSDLPDLAKTAQLHGQGMMSHLEPPFLAGLFEDESFGVDPLERLDDADLGRATAFYLFSRLPAQFNLSAEAITTPRDARPGWYLDALGARPGAVAEAFVTVNRVRVQAKEPPDRHMHDMATKPEYEAVARMAVPRMFKPFPVRCTEAQVESLDPLLRAGLKYMPWVDLMALVRRRLNDPNMDLKQRAAWLAAGVFVDRKACLPLVVGFLTKGEAAIRVRHLGAYLAEYGGRPVRKWAVEWATADLATLIQAVGRSLPRPWEASLSTYSVDEAKVGALVTELIRALAERTDDAACFALTDLVADPDLESWHGELQSGLDDQVLRRRLAAFKAPTVREVRDALDGGPPTGPADLAALVSDELNATAQRIRHDNTDGWEFFWRMDPKNPKGRVPDLENKGRNQLLIHLKPRLEMRQVTLQPEAHHAESKRSDALAIHGVHAVPIEPKRSDSRDLWTGVSNQLVPRYLRDPGSGGYGIYAVLWFGSGHQRASPSGRKPQSPAELKSALEETLTPEQRRTVKVIVIDVSEPTEQ